MISRKDAKAAKTNTPEKRRTVPVNCTKGHFFRAQSLKKRRLVIVAGESDSNLDSFGILPWFTTRITQELPESVVGFWERMNYNRSVGVMRFAVSRAVLGAASGALPIQVEHRQAQQGWP